MRPEDVREHSSAHEGASSAPLQSGGPELSPLAQVASAAGNEMMRSTLARDAPGILDGGRIAPEVENTIASRRGSGSSLPGDTAASLGAKIGDDYSDVRVHTDDTADQLARSVSARAFATGTDVYFARGQYNPGTADGDRLIGHELTHVTQQRGATTGGPMFVSQEGGAEERQADEVASKL